MSERHRPVATSVVGETDHALEPAAGQAAAVSGAPAHDEEQDSRPLWLRGLRWLAHGWWKLFAVVIVGNFVPGAALAALQSGTDALRSYVTTWGLLRPVESSYPLAFWLATAVLAALAVVGLAAEIEERRRAARSAARLHQTAREAQTQSALAQATAQHALEVVTASVAIAANTPVLQLLGPPDDVALLPAPKRFVGRADDLAWVEERLRAGGGEGGAGASTITALRGLGGIGKTTLAAVAVRALQREGCFPDGIAVVLCQQLSDPAEVLRRVLIRFDPYRRAPEASELTQLSDLAQATLRSKKALTVLDNVEPELPLAHVIAPLHAAGLTLLLTARHSVPADLVPPEGSRGLELLRPAEALALFAAALGRGGADLDALTPAERGAAEQIVAALGCHTLAVKLAGAYAAAERRDLSALARELTDPTRGLALPGITGDDDQETPEAVRRTFALSLETLPLDARRLFAALAAFATVECGRQAALALGHALGQAHPERSLHLLLVRALVEPSTSAALPPESDRERLRLHPLLRALAEELYGQWTPAERDVAGQAVAAHLAAYAEAHQNQLTVLAADEGNLTGAVEWAHARGQETLVARLAHGMRLFWVDRGRYQEGLRYFAMAVAAAESLAPERGGSPPAEKVGGEQEGRDVAARRLLAELNLTYAQVLVYAGQPEDGAVVAQRSAEGFRAVHDRRGEGRAISVLGEEAEWRGQMDLAMTYYQTSLAIAREVGDRQAEGLGLSLLGQVALQRDEYAAAEAALQESLPIRHEVGDRNGEAAGLSLLGVLALRRGQFGLAATYQQQCLVMAREDGDRRSESVSLSYLGQCALRQGHYPQAEALFQQSLAIARDIGDRQAEGLEIGLLGTLALQRGQYEDAERLLREALSIRREIKDRQSEAVALTNLGQTALQRGQYEDAATYLHQALTILREVGDHRWESQALGALGRLAEAQDDDPTAEDLYRQSLMIASQWDIGPEAATAQLALGRFLAERLERRDEGCPLLLEAARRLGEMGMPEAEQARAAVARLGCA